MILRLRPEASADERAGVREALAALDVAHEEAGEIVVLGRALAEEEALRLAILPGVAAVAPTDAGTLTLRDSFLRWFTAAALVLGVLVLLASNLPVGLGPPPDPLRTPSVVAPAWPMLAWFALEDRAPPGVPVPLLVLAGSLVLGAWPLLARRLAERRPAVHAALGVLALLGGLWLALLGLRR